MSSIRALWVVLLSIVSASPTYADDSIVTEGVIDAPVNEVWDAWTTTAGLGKWLAPHADIDLRIEGVMRANYDPEGALGDANTIENRILAYEPGRMLAIRAQGHRLIFHSRNVSATCGRSCPSRTRATARHACASSAWASVTIASRSR
jgi:hypothetical protein